MIEKLNTLKAQASTAVVSAMTFNVSSVFAAPPSTTKCNNADIGDAADCVSGGEGRDIFGPDGLFSDLTSIMIFIVGAVSVIMLIVGGMRYVLSSGDQNAVTGAKNTILYAIIGIVVALIAVGAVRFITQGLDA